MVVNTEIVIPKEFRSDLNIIRSLRKGMEKQLHTAEANMKKETQKPHLER